VSPVSITTVVLHRRGDGVVNVRSDFTAAFPEPDTGRAPACSRRAPPPPTSRRRHTAKRVSPMSEYSRAAHSRPVVTVNRLEARLTCQAQNFLCAEDLRRLRCVRIDEVGQGTAVIVDVDGFGEPGDCAPVRPRSGCSRSPGTATMRSVSPCLLPPLRLRPVESPHNTRRPLECRAGRRQWVKSHAGPTVSGARRPSPPQVAGDRVTRFRTPTKGWTGADMPSRPTMSGGRLWTGGVRGVRSRYDGVKRNPWDEFECGHHYARATSSMGAAAGAAGVPVQRARSEIALRAEDCPRRAPVILYRWRGVGTGGDYPTPRRCQSLPAS